MTAPNNVGGTKHRQTPIAGAAARTVRPEPASLPPFLNEAQAAALFGVSDRTFADLRHEAWMPDAMVLGPRSLRWSRDELIEALRQRAPRIKHQPMPSHLALAKGLTDKAGG